MIKKSLLLLAYTLILLGCTSQTKKAENKKNMKNKKLTDSINFSNLIIDTLQFDLKPREIDTANFAFQLEANGNYTKIKAEMRTERLRLQQLYLSKNDSIWKQQILDSARKYLTNALVNKIIPHWYGMPWSFSGYSAIPQIGEVGCSYFVSNTLLHAGFNINRYLLAQQGPLNEAKSIDSSFITYINENDLIDLNSLSQEQINLICSKVNAAIDEKQDLNSIDFENYDYLKNKILQIVNQKRSYLGQMDVNAKAELVWEFYEETLEKVSDFGCKILRLDAFAYLHKEIGQSNFFNKPGTWQYLKRIKKIASKHDLMLLPEIHAEYGLHLHDEVANEGYYIYDFFLPGLTIHSIENGSGKALLTWAKEIISKKYKTVNMLGCHDGIPVLDLKGKEVNGIYNNGLLEDVEIEAIMNKIMERGGRVKNLYDPSGNKISYYQVNATFFSALGEDERKLLLARAIQMFMPGIPQVWYLDLFAGKNDYEAADKAADSGHKEINRSTLNMQDIRNGLQKDIVMNQLKIMRLRNNSDAFLGSVTFHETSDCEIHIEWINQNEIAQLQANLKTLDFSINHKKNGLIKSMNF